MGAIRNLFTGMPPMLDALAQQTNVQLPSFMPQQVCGIVPRSCFVALIITLSSRPEISPGLAPLRSAQHATEATVTRLQYWMLLPGILQYTSVVQSVFLLLVTTLRVCNSASCSATDGDLKPVLHLPPKTCLTLSFLHLCRRRPRHECAAAADRASIGVVSEGNDS